MNKIEKTNQKKGISLVVLIVMIVTMLILISISVLQVKNAIDNADITNFTSILTEVQNGVQTYYITNGKLPKPSNNTSPITKATLLGLVDSQYANELSAELGTNFDDWHDTFYYIDLSKIDVTKSTMGFERLGTNDVFVVSVPNLNVYYVRGITAKSKRFFSLTTSLTGQYSTGLVASTTDTSSTTATTYSGITVSKYNDWTNTMPLTIKSTMAANETLFIAFSNGWEKQLNVASPGIYEKSFNLIDLFSSNSILAAGVSFSQNEIDDFNSRDPVDRSLDVIKKANGIEVGRNRVSVSKFETEIPTVYNVSVANYMDMNTVSFEAYDNLSQIKEIRYDYVTKIGEDGVEAPYYSTAPDATYFDVNYLKTKGIPVKISSNGRYSINFPKNIASIVLLVMDNAGNWVRVEQAISKMMYIGIGLNTVSNNLLTLTANVYSSLGTNLIEFSYSTDAINFVSTQTYTPNTYSTLYSKTISFSGMNASKIYVKIVVEDKNVVIGNRVIYTKVIPISLI